MMMILSHRPAPMIMAALVAAALLAACTPSRAIRGNMLDDYRIAQVVPGTSSQSDVMRALGSPTTTDPFDANTWYYIGQKTEKKGIFDPKVTEEKIYRATFDPETRLLIELVALDTDRNDIPLAREVTPTSGNEMTAVQQMLGNLGKFNKSPKASPTTIGR